ncbi:TetR/AcrR family transcriptional regulator C-terminal domain-containing protein [Nocardia sp. NBC_01009]|uniref:TetR/AcrR family transcriptional regulator C-terminal domain-containing protein n=1 Tax=Nocardia sp. NBC_01009 TaxID=2975996 RepID=UPI00386F3700|nr:TetR/AcrR family transcriptional regulator C-terminal domain-containing protein [Nocardia sp. NBC_01009]
MGGVACQEHPSIEYAVANPYEPDRLEQVVDPVRYPRTAQLVADLFAGDVDAKFDYGLRVILAGILATRTAPERS